MIASNYFFYGYFRSNPRVERVGWNLISLTGDTIVRFPYGLGIASNKHAKLYILGTILLHEFFINKTIILGDSLFIVQQMYKKVIRGGIIYQRTLYIIHPNLEGNGDV